MSNNLGRDCFAGPDFGQTLRNYVGETVTIFTASGGQSGAGFTGVVLSANESFVRLITRIGPPPACALGNACTGFNVGTSANPCSNNRGSRYGNGLGAGAVNAGGWGGLPVWSVGSVADIPVRNIVSFVHNSV